MIPKQNIICKYTPCKHSNKPWIFELVWLSLTIGWKQNQCPAGFEDCAALYKIVIIYLWLIFIEECFQEDSRRLWLTELGAPKLIFLVYFGGIWQVRYLKVRWFYWMCLSLFGQLCCSCSAWRVEVFMQNLEWITSFNRDQLATHYGCGACVTILLHNYLSLALCGLLLKPLCLCSPSLLGAVTYGDWSCFLLLRQNTTTCDLIVPKLCVILKSIKGETSQVCYGLHNKCCGRRRGIAYKLCAVIVL